MKRNNRQIIKTDVKTKVKIEKTMKSRTDKSRVKNKTERRNVKTFNSFQFNNNFCYMSQLS